MARRIVAALLIVIAGLLAPFAVGALWAQRTLTDTTAFNETLAPLAEDPVVRQTVATEASDAIVSAVDAESRAEELLGRLAGPLSGLRSERGSDSVLAAAIASGVNDAIVSGVNSYVQSDAFGQGWLGVTTALHEQLVRLIERDTADAALTLQDGQIVLNTAIALERVQAQLGERGVPFAGRLEVAGRDIVLADSPNLESATRALNIFLPVGAWLWVVVVALFGVGILLWPARSRGVLWTGVALAIGGVLLYLGLDLGTAAIVDSAPTGYAQLVDSVSSTLLRFLVNAVLVMICVGLALALAGWLAGATGSGRRVRDRFAGVAHRAGRPLAGGPLARFTSDHPMFVPTLRAGVLLAAAAFLLLRDRLDPAAIAGTFVVTAIALLVVEVIEGAGLGYEARRSGALIAQSPAPHTSAPAP